VVPRVLLRVPLSLPMADHDPPLSPEHGDHWSPAGESSRLNLAARLTPARWRSPHDHAQPAEHATRWQEHPANGLNVMGCPRAPVALFRLMTPGPLAFQLPAGRSDPVTLCATWSRWE
jgi:hypothetical protein